MAHQFLMYHQLLLWLQLVLLRLGTCHSNSKHKVQALPQRHENFPRNWKKRALRSQS
ncbi:hypothetical protein I79_006840 [Cricetulus griseus]|uniref:Uncharacterized protein n=1 Tax=Cricetulus griseus TaxID=10029 RepID=G3H8Z1_CRIGR|nr:hypothetical protein I79_006840 [Cricetulus griseus]